MLSAVVDSARGQREKSAALCLHQMFEAQAERTPGAVAVSFADQALTYHQLNARANQLAHELRERGVGPGTLVGMCAENSPELIAWLLAILKAGGAYVPLDPAYPRERLDFMLRDASARLVLTQSHLRDKFAALHMTEMLCLDTDAPAWASRSRDNLNFGTDPDGVAYVIYTSGSTGQPKGVVLAHQGVVNNLRWRQNTFPLTTDDRLLQTYSLSFDPSVWAIFWPLAAGATLVLPRPGGIADSDYLAETLTQEKITVAGFSPTMLQTLLSRSEIGHCRSLRHVFCGGEAMPPDLPGKFYASLSATLHNMYGPTEATIDAACWTVPRGAETPVIPIGFPIANTELFLLDSQMRPVADGETGEIYIAGVGLAQGYWNRPELTAERFLSQSPVTATGKRLYRSGDLARRGSAGELYFEGRADGQVKLRGFRIEMEEIEATLCCHPGIKDAVAVLREDQPGQKRVAAYLVAAEDPPPPPAELRQFLAQTLPVYMIPAAFVFLPDLPVTLSGKRDRLSLPPPRPETWERGSDFVPPLDPVQHQLIQIWEDLLDIRPIGIRDSFRDLGGHSLLATRMLDQVALACGRTLPLSALYESDTVEHLADTLRRKEPAPETERAMTIIAPGSGRRPFFFIYGFHPLGGFYCHHVAHYLHPDQPFYALHPPMVAVPKITIEGMAMDYLRAIRQAQPEGPYRIGGFCGSGLVAYEMARLLRDQGQEVEFLALIEVHSINAALRLCLRRLAGNSSRFLRLERSLLPRHAALQSQWRKARKRIASLVIEECDRAAAAYVPLTYAGPVALFIAKDDPKAFPGDPLVLWREVAPELTVHPIPGTHLSCLLDEISGLGESLGSCLNALS